MICAAWCTVPLLQGLGPSPLTESAIGLTAQRFPWLLPLTLSTLLKKEPWVQLTGKVHETKEAKTISSVILNYRKVLFAFPSHFIRLCCHVLILFFFLMYLRCLTGFCR